MKKKRKTKKKKLLVLTNYRNKAVRAVRHPALKA